MKTLNIPLEDKEHEALSKIKGNNTWREFIMQLAEHPYSHLNVAERAEIGLMLLEEEEKKAKERKTKKNKNKEDKDNGKNYD